MSVNGRTDYNVRLRFLETNRQQRQQYLKTRDVVKTPTLLKATLVTSLKCCLIFASFSTVPPFDSLHALLWNVFFLWIITAHLFSGINTSSITQTTHLFYMYVKFGGVRCQAGGTVNQSIYIHSSILRKVLNF